MGTGLFPGRLLSVQASLGSHGLLGLTNSLTPRGQPSTWERCPVSPSTGLGAWGRQQSGLHVCTQECACTPMRTHVHTQKYM